MPTHNPSDHAELVGHRAARDRALFIRGVLGESTYRACLINLGLRGQDISSEVELAKLERTTAQTESLDSRAKGSAS